MPKVGKGALGKSTGIIVVLTLIVCAGVWFEVYITPRPSQKTIPADNSDHAQASALMNDASEQMKAGNPNEAVILLDKAAAADRSWSIPVFAKAQMYAASGKEKEAAATLEGAYKDFPKDPEAGLLLLRNMMATKSPVEYEQIARHVILLQSEAGEPHFYLAQSLIAQQNPAKYPEAQKELEYANKKSPKQPNVKIELGHLAEISGDHAGAIKHLTESAALVDDIKASGNSMRKATDRRNIAFWMSNAYAALKDTKNQDLWSKRLAKLDKRMQQTTALRAKASGTPPDQAAIAELNTLMEDPTFADY